MGGNKLSPGSNNGKILRSGRSRRPPNTFTPSRPSVVVSNTKEMNYEFSKKKAATKKMLATLRESDVDVELKHETLVMTFSAAAYEIFKNAVFTYFKTSAERSHKIHNKTSKSNDGQIHIVEESLSIGDKNVKGQLYRLNMFHTTSRVDVNGRHMAEFVNVDVHKILDSVCTMGDLRILNENIHRACQKFLQSEENQNANACKVTTVESSSRVVALNAIRDVDCIDCKVCGSKCMTKSVQCDQCLMWLHYKCVKLTKTEIDNLEKNTGSIYTCTECHSKDIARTVVKHPSSICSSVSTSSAIVEEQSSSANTSSAVVKQPSVSTSSTSVVKQPSVSTSSAMVVKQSSSDDSNTVVTNTCSRVKETVPKSLFSVDVQGHQGSRHTHVLSTAAEILAEEVTQLCTVCNEEVDRESCEVCDTCMNICHLDCLQVKSDLGRVYICITCHGAEDQQRIESNTQQKEIQPARQKTKISLNSKNSTEKQQSSVEKCVNNKEEVTVKMKDIRAKETKLRKWEEDLKVK